MEPKQLEQQVSDALQQDPREIAERVRRLTLDALSGRPLDTAGMRETFATVTDGVRTGAAKRSARMEEAVKEAMHGMDGALRNFAEATSLAIQEARGKGKDYSAEEFASLLEDVKSLQSLMADTFAKGARQATGAAQTTFTQLADHARIHGTSAGRELVEIQGKLTQTLAELTRETISDGAHTLQASGRLLAGLTAGFLRGIADRLQDSADTHEKP
ncbi:hypothetical protein G3580_07045 [Nitrogeniibacter mangrovi]|uniref:Uncharacterized protein n=1 Tax=Nitrogeniibacter mangrovi TaxID=2016596 RepID=A0A6C1B228_9RHOO|nr:DUF6781 family protein [Nitrogeniibacter mangrovi]QID17423.1 hypothetical protein G3580_07045 [Nitrogeniibacter mangrovi]